MDKIFVPEAWEEDILPAEAAHYIECEVCTPQSRIVWGEGKPGGPIFIVLDNPGAREDKKGTEFICGTRITLQEGLNKVKIPKDNIYLTYLLKCRPLGKYDKEEARSFSKPFLERQIYMAEPSYILCLGDTVVQCMFNDSDAHVKDLRGRWHILYGYPTVVSYHPLAVRRRPNLRKCFIEDLEMLSQDYLYALMPKSSSTLTKV